MYHRSLLLSILSTVSLSHREKSVEAQMAIIVLSTCLFLAVCLSLWPYILFIMYKHNIMYFLLTPIYIIYNDYLYGRSLGHTPRHRLQYTSISSLWKVRCIKNCQVLGCMRWCEVSQQPPLINLSIHLETVLIHT